MRRREVTYLQGMILPAELKRRVERTDVFAQDQLCVSIVVLHFVFVVGVLDDLGRPIHAAELCLLPVFGWRPPDSDLHKDVTVDRWWPQHSSFSRED